MTLRYTYLRSQKAIFKAMTGLYVHEFDDLLQDVQPRLATAERYDGGHHEHFVPFPRRLSRSFYGRYVARSGYGNECGKAPVERSGDS